MKIIDSNFDNSVLNGLEFQLFIVLGIPLILVLILKYIFMILLVPNKIAGPVSLILFLILSYYLFMAVTS
ncbi:hypothetical protein JFL43_03090 [Viridibacillus sp. YIM B01967]|uniref:Uncharacterized protein n=1 Tax=Viridibacillus soli TaxID=2798301 RepID=A0ABS1H385_9BACL|nr:hypothetical protein [Viridibacillus soli]MBK3493858.1 hypothetical protein [Viridibacillus soli]